jgi:hypothetical protein
VTGIDATVHGAEAREADLRRRLVRAAAALAVLAALHFADHAVRGELVRHRGLDPTWDHSGWPFKPAFTPFNVSFIAVYGLLLGGIVFTRRHRLWAGYWLATSIVLAAIVVWVHFLAGLAGGVTESPSVIQRSYDNPALGIPALIVVFAIIGGLLLMAVQAVWVGRVSGRW